MKTIKIYQHPDCTNLIQGRRSDAIYCSNGCCDSHRNKLKQLKSVNREEVVRQQVHQSLISFLEDGKNELNIDLLDLNIEIPNGDVIVCERDVIEFYLSDLRVMIFKGVIYFRRKNRSDETNRIN